MILITENSETPSTKFYNNSTQSSDGILMEPEVLARVVQIAASQIANTSKLTSSNKSIQSASVQTMLSFPGGEYVGDTKNGRPHGKGIYTYGPGHEYRKYDGQWENGRFHGRGILICSDGSTFEGQWQKGLFHGRGTCIYEDGHKYEGQWQFGNRHGKGTIIYQHGGTYVGEWAHNEWQGKGKLTYSNRATYEGEFLNGNKHGFGKEVNYPLRRIYTGLWENDLYSGEGTLEILDSPFSKYKGTFRKGTLWEGTCTDNKGTYQVHDGIEKHERMVCCSIQ